MVRIKSKLFGRVALVCAASLLGAGGAGAARGAAYEKPTRLAFVGDIMLHEPQLTHAKAIGGGAFDFDGAFSHIKDYITEADCAVGNLETVFGGEASGYTDFPVFNAPDEFGAAISRAGFDLLTTANNHCNDRRESGVLRTIDVLDGLGLAHVGTYASQESRDAVLIREINGIRFAFLAFTYGTNGLPLAKGKPYLANVMSEALIKADIERAKAAGPDFIVVLPHMGNEYEQAPKQTFKDWAMFMFKCGADVVVASHPHVLQPAEFVTVDGRECFVAYSLGNFISSQRTLPRDAGVILNMDFLRDKSGKPYISAVSFVPTWVRFKNADGVDDIAVLPVKDTSEAADGGEMALRAKDAARLNGVWADAARLFGDKAR